MRSNDATPVGRVLKQREPYIVYIKSTDSSVFINLPNLVPHFQNVSSANNYNSSDFYYQVRSFRCKNRFYNLKMGDKIILNARILWWENLSHNDYVTFDEQDITISLNDGTQDKMVTSYELINILNTGIRYFLMSYWFTTVNNIPRDYFITEFMNAFYYAQFAFDSTTGKMVLEFDASTEPYKVYNYELLSANEPINTNSWIRRLWITMKVPTDLLPAEQVRIAQMFGLSTYIETADEYTVNNETVVNRGIYIAYVFDTEDLADLVSKSIEDESIPYYENYTDFRTNDSFTRLVYAPASMNMFRYDKLYIRSSLSTNIWNYDGRRSNVIAVVPIEGSLTGAAVAYEPVGSSQRTYHIKDSITSIQNFQISITDEYDDVVQFNDEYELFISFFFTPDEAVLATM